MLEDLLCIAAAGQRRSKDAGERAKDVMRRFVLSQPSPTLYSLLELERLGIHAGITTLASGMVTNAAMANVVLIKYWHTDITGVQEYQDANARR